MLQNGVILVIVKIIKSEIYILLGIYGEICKKFDYCHVGCS